MLLLFVAFWCGMLAVEINGYVNGSPAKFAWIYDVQGQVCGQVNRSGYSYAYWPNPSNVNSAYCVQACPSTYAADAGCYPGTATLGSCVAYPSQLVFGTMCAPQSTTNVTGFSSVTSAISANGIGSAFQDVSKAWQVELGMAFFAFGVGFLFMILMKYCAGVVAWTSILFTIGSFILMGVYCYQAYTDYQSGVLVGSSSNMYAMLAFSIIGFVFAGLTILFAICMFQRIRLAIAVIKTAAEFVGDCMGIVFVPTVYFFVLACFFVLWLSAQIFIFSCGNFSYNGSPFASVQITQSIQYSSIYHFFGLLWTCAFFGACCQFIVASTACVWYFSPVENGNKVMSSPISTSIFRLFRYHVGSMAFGALVLSIVQFIRWVVAYLQRKADVENANFAVKCVACCIDCILACVERFIMFLNKNAYIQVALSGKSFCSAAWAAFQLILRNALRFTAFESIVDVFLSLGILTIAMTPAVTGYIIMTKSTYFTSMLSSPLIPTTIIFIWGYVVGASFMNVYASSASAILQCFIIDEEMCGGGDAGGSQFMAQHCPESLKEIVGNNFNESKQ